MEVTHIGLQRRRNGSSESGSPFSLSFRGAGTISKLNLLFLASVVIVLGLSFAALKLRPDAQEAMGQRNLVRIYCASALAKPVQRVVDRFNSELDANVQILRTGGSGELAGQIKTEFDSSIDYGADILISADDELVNDAIAAGRISDRFLLANQKPVIAVTGKSNTHFKSLRELVASDLRFGIASERAAIGKTVRSIARQEGCLDLLESRKTTDAENVMTLAQSLLTGSLDAAVLWDTTVVLVNESVKDAEQKIVIAADVEFSSQFQRPIVVGVISTTRSNAESLRFAKYLTDPQQFRKDFEEYGFTPMAAQR